MVNSEVRRENGRVIFSGKIGAGQGEAGGSSASYSETGMPTGAVPNGYMTETLNIVTDTGIVKRTVLTRIHDRETVEDWGSGDSRLLLAVSTAGKLRISKGYLKE